MHTSDLSRATWRKSSYSNGSGGSCVEIAELTVDSPKIHWVQTADGKWTLPALEQTAPKENHQHRTKRADQQQDPPTRDTEQAALREPQGQESEHGNRKRGTGVGPGSHPPAVRRRKNVGQIRVGDRVFGAHSIAEHLAPAYRSALEFAALDQPMKAGRIIVRFRCVSFERNG